MPEPDFFDFMLEGGYDLIFDDNDEFECLHCGYMITPEEVDTFDKDFGTIKCPSCGEEIELDL